jgi:hypothetical protein
MHERVSILPERFVCFATLWALAGQVSSKEDVQRKTAQVWHALYGVASAAQQAVDQKK